MFGRDARRIVVAGMALCESGQPMAWGCPEDACPPGLEHDGSRYADTAAGKSGTGLQPLKLGDSQCLDERLASLNFAHQHCFTHTLCGTPISASGFCVISWSLGSPAKEPRHDVLLAGRQPLDELLQFLIDGLDLLR